MPVNYLPLSVIGWQNAIRAVILDTVAVVAEYEDWEIHSQNLTMKVPSIIMSKRHLHFDHQVAFSDEKVFLRDRFTCQYCHTVFSENRLTMDHVVPRSKGGKTTWTNITTACGPCNFNKGSNRKIVPIKMPHKPSYYELLGIRKEYPLVVHREDWADFLDWPEENIRFSDKKILSQRLAA